MSSELDEDEVVFGKNAVLAFLDAQASVGADSSKAERDETPQVCKIFVADGMRSDRRLDQIKQLAKQEGVPISIVERRRLARMAGGSDHHQGIIAQLSKVPLKTLTEFLPRLENQVKEGVGPGKRPPLVVILDGMED